jgi:phospholipid/cholesterol/gamma-HCH transport system substrate-binding protein
MKNQASSSIKLGVFVLSAITFFILGLYYIGSKRNIFHSTINVNAVFDDVNGLIGGGEVRFNGINVGNVSKVYAISDSAIKVEFTIDESTSKYIAQDATASIGTDGLLGNKIVNISPGTKGREPIHEGFEMRSLHSVEMESAMRTLSATNGNLKLITENLKVITGKINESHSFWKLFSDTALSENVKNALVNIRLTSSRTAVITGDLSSIIQNIKDGKGTIGSLLTDTTLSKKLEQTIVTIKIVGDSMALVTGDLRNISRKINNGQGAVGTLLTDTSFVRNLNKSMENLKNGSDNFNENMVALKSSWPFKKYFKKQAKKSK